MPGLAVMLLADPGSASPATHAGTDVWQGLVSSSIQAQREQGKLRREPDFKVMENSQDQHEELNFKYSLLCFEKLKP